MQNQFKKAALEFTRLVRSFPKWAGNEAKNHFVDSFRKQGWDGENWQDRKYPDKNTKRRAILVKTGRLKRSIKVSSNGVVSTDVPYAEIHNEGGTIDTTQSIRAHRRIVKTRNTYNGRKKASSGITFVKAHTRKVRISIPRRQFMGNSRVLVSTLENELKTRFNDILKPLNITENI